MPHYFFHIRNGEYFTPDDEGGDFDDYAGARREAVMSVRDLVLEAVKFGDSVAGWKIEIADDNGKILGFIQAKEVLH